MFSLQTILVLVSANLLVVGAAIYGRIERRGRESRTMTTNRPSGSSPPDTSNIELTRISTSHNDSIFTVLDEDYDYSEEASFIQETRPLFRSLVDWREREDGEMSAMRRITV